MDHEPLLQRISERLKALGLSERKACLNAGLHVDTIRRIRQRGQAPRADALAKLAHALKVPSSYLLEAAVNFEPPPTAHSIKLAKVFVRGFVQAGVWQEATEWPSSDWYPLSVPLDTRFPDTPLFALQVRGDSMNRLYPDGSHVVCVRYADIGRGPRPGERVVCVRGSATGEFEATVKEYQIDDKGRHVLWPRSDAPEFQQPFVLDGDLVSVTTTDDDIPQVVYAGHFADDGGQPPLSIAALVIQSVRLEPVS